jgi:hypothetical protein
MSSTKGYKRIDGKDSSGKGVYVYVKPDATPAEAQAILSKKVAASDRKTARDKTTVSSQPGDNLIGPLS